MDVHAPGEFHRLLEQHKLVVVDYHAAWCGPCKAYSPKFNRLEREMRRAVPDASVTFVSVDIDRAHDLAKAGGVQSVPTTIAWTLGKSLLGRPRPKPVLRFSGDRAWNELVRTLLDVVRRHAR